MEEPFRNGYMGASDERGRMRRALALLLAVPLLAGCAGTPVTPTPETAAPASSGAVPPSSFRCASGEAIVGFDATGDPLCEPFVRSTTAREATAEVSSNLMVMSVYGERDDAASSPIRTVHVALTLAAGALPLDMSAVVVRVSDGANTAALAARDATSGAAFDAVWIRGDGAGGRMEPGDLVEISFDPPAPLATRTSVALSIIPEAGSAVTADFKTPATYGTATTITLR